MRTAVLQLQGLCILTNSSFFCHAYPRSLVFNCHALIHGETDVQVGVGRAKRGDEIQQSPDVILHCLLPGAAVQARVCQIRFHATPVLVYLIKMSYHSERPSPRKIPWMAQS